MSIINTVKRKRDTPDPGSTASSIPRPPTGTQNVRILGDLILPAPSTCGLDGELENMVTNLLPDVQVMNSRDLSSKAYRKQANLDITNNDAEIAKSFQRCLDAFETFKAEETKIWQSLGRQPPAGDHFVCPSGSLDSGLIHHLHQPSYSTLYHKDTTTADPSNGCIAMLMSNAFKENETLLIDDLHRRSEKSEGYATYPKEVIECHERFTQDICESSTAKVEIMYGVHVQKRVLKRWKITPLPLWGALSGIFLFLVEESNFRNEDKKYRFRRVLMFACHPQRLYYEKEGSALAQQQDTIALVATKIVRDGTPCIENYFRDKKWRDPFNMRRQMEIKARNAALEEGFDTLQWVEEVRDSENSTLVDPDEVEEDRWGSFFSAVPHSNDKLRQLGPLAIKSLNDDSAKQWDSPSDFPDAVQDWFRGQKEILFYSRPIHGTSDIEEIFKDSFMSTDKKSATFSLKDMLRHMMLQQSLILGEIKEKNQEFYHSRFDGQSIDTCCHICNSKMSTDHESRWSTKRPGFYLARKGRCRGCSGNLRTRMPVDASIAWVPGTKPAMRKDVPPEQLQIRRPVKVEGPWVKCMQKDGKADRNLPGIVACWCIHCKNRTKHSKGAGPWLDTKPRWTYGHLRPLYIEREVQCLTCVANGFHTGRFIPVDDTPSVYTRRLTGFAKSFGMWHPLIQAKLLDAWVPASKEPHHMKTRAG
jgi:hypothetical protein